MNRREIGRIGEEAVVRFLQKKGYEILDRNYSYSWSIGIKRGEIDIVALKDGIIHFIEVKSLKKDGDFYPEDKINRQKRKRVQKAAQIWLLRHGLQESSWQIDAAGVILDLKAKKARISHFKDIAADD